MKQKKKQHNQSNDSLKNIQKSNLDNRQELLELLENKDNLSKDELEGIVIKILRETKTTTISGPIPDPATLELYNKIIPDGANRIFTNFEEQSKHRRELEAVLLPSREKQSGRGQFFAFILGLLTLFSIVYLASIDMGWIAGVLASVLLSLTGSYFYGVSKQNKSLIEKNNNAEKSDS